MKKFLIALSLALMVMLPVNVHAAPSLMPDGTVFDPVFYSETYPDVVAVFGNSPDMLYAHYLYCGKAEGRRPADTKPVYPGTVQNAFDPVYYANRYPDVVAVLGSSPDALALHYDLCGKAEGRFANASEETDALLISYANPGAEHVEPVSPYGIDPASYANQLYQLVNQQRKNYGVPQLVWNPALNNAVSVRAVEVSQSFSHIRPNGLSFNTTLNGIAYWNCGEIISSSPYSPTQVMEAWMNDPSDRYEILKSNYTGMAVGYYYNPLTPDKYYWVIIFTV